MKSEKNWLIVTAVIVLLLCSIASYINRPLPAYIDTPKDTADENKSSIPEMSIYETDSLSFPYPASWRQILKSGNVTFLSSDGSYLMLQESTYNAQINNATESSVQQELAASGLTFIYFEKLTTSSFLLSYQEGTIYTWEYVMWDLDSEYRLILSYEDPSSYEELALYIFESFHWDKIRPIPENLFLVYSIYGNFEFAIPSGWTTQTSGASFNASNMQTGSQLSVTASQTDLPSLSGITQIQYAEKVSQLYPGLMLKSYGAADEQVTAEAVYNSQAGEQTLFYHIMYLKNGFLYEFLLNTPYSAGSDDYDNFMDCIQYFRCF